MAIKDFIRTKIRNIFSKELWDFSITKWQLEDIQAFGFISSISTAGNYVPITNWGMRPAMIAHILNEIVINKRKNIIEFGSGVSTIYISRLIKQNNLDITFASVESNMDWIKILKAQLNEENLGNCVSFIHAPINVYENSQWYDKDIIMKNIKDDIDMIIVDGPIGIATPLARFDAIPFIKKYLSQNFIVFLDDTQRKDEKKIINEWEKILNIKSETFNRYSILKSSESFSSSPIFYSYKYTVPHVG